LKPGRYAEIGRSAAPSKTHGDCAAASRLMAFILLTESDGLHPDTPLEFFSGHPLSALRIASAGRIMTVAQITRGANA
jgi:hypothetical protein